MATGIVKWFDSKKGYGFVQPDDGGKDVFIHISAVQKIGLTHLKEGQKLKYDLVSNRGRDAADNLELIG